MARLLPLLAALSVLLTALFVADTISSKRFSSKCEMTYSWPVYSPVSWRGFPTHNKYQLYRVDMKQQRERLSGVPVLFLPGHLGSYKQARSLSRHLWDLDPTLFDVFALDFAEEPTGLNGNFIRDQAAFTNEAIRAIMREYKRQSKRSNKIVLPESVIVVAHSMGGVVARTAEMLPNYKRRSIQHVVALGVPYETPSFQFDSEVNALYEKMHAKKDGDVVYVAVSGGHKDTLVTASFTSVDSVAEPSHAFAALTAAMPTVQTPVDHFCLLWCHQLLKLVAKSLYNAVDLETRELMSDPSIRLAVAQDVLLGIDAEKDVEIDSSSNVSLHRTYVNDGYYPGEYAGYGMLLPQFLTHLLRTRFLTVFVIMYVLALQIFYAQVAQWQSRFNLQSSASPQDISQENFPSFTSMLHPFSHAPAILKNGASFVGNFLHGRTSFGLSTTVAASVVVLLAVGAVTMLTGFGKSEVSFAYETLDRLTSHGTAVVDLLVLYVYALGLLYAFARLLSLVQRVIVSPIVSALNNVTEQLKVQRWMVVAVSHAVVLLLGQVKGFDSARVLASSVVVAFGLFIVYMLALGGSADGSADQQRMRRSLFAVLWLSIFPWVGKIAYFGGMLTSSPSEVSNDLLVEGGSYVAILSLFVYLIGLSLDQMIPLPPTAFFGASSGQDAASIYGSAAKSADSDVKITAENCPKCVFEDGGPGAVLVEYSDRSTRRIVAGKPREVVYVGPTFRVVSCDCVYRFKNSRDFCAFCIRSCRLCGGGNGNFQEAAKYKDFLEESKMDLAMHALVPMIFQICAAVQATYGLHRAHLSFYLTPVCVVALVVITSHFATPSKCVGSETDRKERTRKKGPSRRPRHSKTQPRLQLPLGTQTAPRHATRRKRNESLARQPRRHR